MKKKKLVNAINKIKQYANNGVLYVFFGSIITKFTMMFATIFLVRFLSKNDYNVLAYVDNIFGYVYLFAGLGLANAILRYVVIEDDLQGKKAIFDFIIRKGTIINFILVTIGGFFSIIYEHPVSFKPYALFIIVMILTVPFKFLIEGSLFLDRAMMNAKRYAVFAFVSSTGLIVSRLVGARFDGLRGAVIGSLIIEVCLGCILLFLVIRKYFQKVRFSSILLPKKKREIHIYSFQYMITNGLWTVFALNDVFILGRLSAEEYILAEYKVASVLPGCLSLISVAIGICVAPMFTRKEHDGDYNWVKTNWIITVLISSIAIAMCSIVLAIFAEPIITLIYGKEYVNVSSLMKLLLISALLNSGVRYSTANILAAMGKIRCNLIVSAIGMTLQVLLDIIFIKKLGSIGVAYAGIVSNMFMCVVLIIYFHSIYIKKGVTNLSND